jgi:hypothetical protein
MSILHVVGREEWYDIAQGYTTIACRSPRSNLLELSLGLESHCTVRSFIVKVHSLS